MERFTSTEKLIKDIKKTMIDSDTTQADIARALGIKPQSVTTMLKKKNFSFEDAEKILKEMGCSLFYEIRKDGAD